MLIRALRMLLLCLSVMFCAACKKKEEKKSSRKVREEALLKNTAKHQAVKAFTDALRSVFEWQQVQPPIQTASERQALGSALAQRISQVPTKDLPPDLLKAWQSMLAVWQASASQPQLNEVQCQLGSEAAAELNRQLAAVGVVDLHF